MRPGALHAQHSHDLLFENERDEGQRRFRNVFEHQLLVGRNVPVVFRFQIPDDDVGTVFDAPAPKGLYIQRAGERVAALSPAADETVVQELFFLVYKSDNNRRRIHQSSMRRPCYSARWKNAARSVLQRRALPRIRRARKGSAPGSSPPPLRCQDVSTLRSRASTSVGVPPMSVTSPSSQTLFFETRTCTAF